MSLPFRCSWLNLPEVRTWCVDAWQRMGVALLFDFPLAEELWRCCQRETDFNTKKILQARGHASFWDHLVAFLIKLFSHQSPNIYIQQNPLFSTRAVLPGCDGMPIGHPGYLHAFGSSAKPDWGDWDTPKRAGGNQVTFVPDGKLRESDVHCYIEGCNT